MHAKEPWCDKTYIDRFWSRVDIKGSDECWEWNRGATAGGYGVFHFGHSSVRAHRFAYQATHGAIREHDCVCHSCDNPKCVNPAHLWIWTRAENNADKEAKNRAVHPDQKSGEGNSNASLTTPEVVAIRVMARKGMPQARIANYLDVSAATVCMVVSGGRRAEETERRVSACVNACAGITTGDLEAATADRRHRHEIIADLVAANKHRDELLSAVKELMTATDVVAYGSALAKARAAIAKAEAEK